MPTETQLRLLLDNLTTAVILLNAELRLEYMNPAAEMLLAVSGQRSHGQFISELFTESPEALQSLRQAVEEAHPFTKREATLTSLTGQTITVDYAVTPILDRRNTLLLLEVHPLQLVDRLLLLVVLQSLLLYPCQQQQVPDAAAAAAVALHQQPHSNLHKAAAADKLVIVPYQ